MLFLFTQKFHSRNWLFILILWSVIFHLEFPAAILLFPCLFLFWFKNKQFFSLNNYLLVPGILILAFLPYLVFDFKNNHLLSNALFQLILHPNPNPLAWPAFFRNFYTALSRELTLTIFPSSPQTSKLLIIVGLFSLFKNRKHSYSPFILVGLLSLVGLILIHSVPMPQIIVWLLPFFYFPTALALEIVPRSSLKIIFLTLILFANFNYWLRRIDSSENFFFRSYQYTFLANQKQILDYVYQKADGQPFSYHYYTYPYWLPQAWQYLFNWYGQKQYNYQPSDKITNPFYVVIEPDETMPGYQKDWYQKMNRESQKIDEFQTGRLKVEQHRLISHP